MAINKKNVKIKYVDGNGDVQSLNPIPSTANDIYYDNTEEYTVSDKINELNNTIENRKNIGKGWAPIYLDNGIPKQISSNVGDVHTPIYLENGYFKPFTQSIGNANHPIYLKNGELIPIRESYRSFFFRMIDEATKNNPIVYEPNTAKTYIWKTIKTIDLTSDSFQVWGDVQKNYDLDNIIKYGDTYRIAPDTVDELLGNLILTINLPSSNSFNSGLAASTITLIYFSVIPSDTNSPNSFHTRQKIGLLDTEMKIKIPFKIALGDSTTLYIKIRISRAISIKNMGIEFFMG